MMKVLVTGANGFLGKNLISELERREGITILPFELETSIDLLDAYCAECGFVYNLAGVNRPENVEEFMKGNFVFVTRLVEALERHGNKCPVMNASSIQAELDNPYGRSKKAGEETLASYGERTGAPIYNYRFPNVFGKWCRPGYNSAVATFCNNIAHDLPIQVNNPDTVMHLVYIDDVVQELLSALEGRPHVDAKGYCYVPVVHEVTLGEIVDLLYSFRKSRENLMVPRLEEGSFEKKLYSTYLSFLPRDQFSYPLTMRGNARGTFTEILKSTERGQVSVNITKPGVRKGNHWHQTKNEKFVVVSGKAVIRFRKHGEEEIVQYHVCGEKLEVVDIPPGYVHSIENEGETDLVTLIWGNECYDPERPDTIQEDVD